MKRGMRRLLPGEEAARLAKIQQLYCEERLTLREVGLRLELSAGRVHQILKAAGIPRRAPVPRSWVQGRP